MTATWYEYGFRKAARGPFVVLTGVDQEAFRDALRRHLEAKPSTPDPDAPKVDP